MLLMGTKYCEDAKKVKTQWRCVAKSAGKESVLPPFPIQVTASLNLYRRCCFLFLFLFFGSCHFSIL